MWTDAVDLRDFYDTRLGQMARQLIRRRLRALWPEVRGETVLGLGYANPYLRQFRDEAARVLAFMPAGQGVLRWPPEGPNVAALVDEGELPLQDASVDRVLLVHAVEAGERLPELLNEVWRVMAGNGRLLVVVPNRRGIWARSDRTPFGQGHPYSPAQLSRLLREHRFTPLRSARALHWPPLRARALLRFAPAWERIGARWFSTFAGVVMVEAAKQIYAATAVTARHRRPRAAVLTFPRPARPAVQRLDTEQR
jgi:SAM-dependent methyltransferase